MDNAQYHSCFQTIQMTISFKIKTAGIKNQISMEVIKYEVEWEFFSVFFLHPFFMGLSYSPTFLSDFSLRFFNWIYLFFTDLFSLKKFCLASFKLQKILSNNCTFGCSDCSVANSNHTQFWFTFQFWSMPTFRVWPPDFHRTIRTLPIISFFIASLGPQSELPPSENSPRGSSPHPTGVAP